MAVISVIVPCYNAEKYMTRCIDSILCQSIGINNIELILVNDASTDATLEILESYERMYPDNIMVVNCEKNGKPGTARDIGIMYSTCEYITFVDADDCIEPAMLQYMYHCAVQYDCDLVECGFDAFDEEPVYGYKFQDYSLFDIDSVELRKQMLIYSCNRKTVWGKLYRRKFIVDNDISFPENVFYEDVFFSQLTALYTKKYCRTATVFYHYHFNGNEVMYNSDAVDRLIMQAQVQDGFVDEVKKRGLTDTKLLPYRDEIEYMAIHNMLIYPYDICVALGQNMLETPMYELLNRIKKMFPDFIHNPYIVSDENECTALVTVLEGLEQAKEQARDYAAEDAQKYNKDKTEYIRQAGTDCAFAYEPGNDFPCLSDYRQEAGSVDAHYFFQDIYVANKVMKSGINHVYDIGSRVDGYISHLLSMDIKVTMLDIRPLPEKIENLDFIQANAMKLENIQQKSIQVLSCLHALEHFGLGRYGDAVDYYGWKKALAGYVRVMSNGGTLYLSVPVGKKQKVMFNAHRIFRPSTIAKEVMGDLILQEFTYFHYGVRTTLDFSHEHSSERIVSILDDAADNYLGNYDCGIFIFQKELLNNE